MKISRAILTIACGVSIPLIAMQSPAGEDYCTYEGPDIMTHKVADAFGTYDLDYYGQQDGIGGFAMATTSGNPGDMVAQWAQSGDGTKSPVIAQNVYRLCDGRFEQIGLSWLKHSFCAVSEAMCSCQGTGCSTLGIGCGDTYWASLNADAEAPRSEINATTGDYLYPFFQSPCGSSSMRGKLQISEEDRDPSLNAGCHFYLEGQYVSANADIEWGFDEYDFDNQFNNVSYREIRFTTTTTSSPIGSTKVMQTALDAWAFEEGAEIVDVWTNEGDGFLGLMHIAYLVTDNGDGTWHYELVVHNQNSHRSAGSFSVPVADCVELENIEFVDVDYHSCELVDDNDWTVERADGMLTWYTTPYSEDETGFAFGNAIRWSSSYTFRFDANYPPSEVNSVLGLWRPGPDGDEIEVGIMAPNPDCTGDCPSDLNGDGTVNVNDILDLIAAWGGPDGDVDGDGNTNVNDLLLMLEFFGQDC
ncbi:MAG: hypothetical protein P8M22_10925 [Phycisphaerales bacterium]|nr:hypothetical protein [Phycisphaerales bacterium]